MKKQNFREMLAKAAKTYQVKAPSGLTYKLRRPIDLDYKDYTLSEIETEAIRKAKEFLSEA